MTSLMVLLAAVLVPLAVVVGFLVVRVRSRYGFSKRAALATLILNGFGLGVLAIVWLSSSSPAFAQGGSQALSGEAGLGFLAAGLATGLSTIGAGIAVGITGAAAIGAITEKPEVVGRSLIIVGLAEGIAIYGLIIAILILARI